MNIKEFLLSQDTALVAQKYCLLRNFYDEKDFPSTEIVESGMRVFLDKIAKIEYSASDEFVLIPATYSESGINHVHGDLYRKADLDSYTPSLDDAGFDERMEKVRTCELSNISSYYDFSFPDCYSFAMSSWSEVLGYGIVLPNHVAENADAMAELAEDILWEMTFHGMDENEHEERVEEIEEMLVQAQKDIDKGHVYSQEKFEEHMEKIGYKDTRTQEEKDTTKREMYIELLMNAKNQNKAILDYQTCV